VQLRNAVPRRLGGSLGLAFAVCVTAALLPATAAASPRGLRFKGAPRLKSNGNLIDHGGLVLPTSKTYAIFWGPANAWASDVESSLGSLFSGFGGSNYLAIAAQYMRGASISSTYAGPQPDPSPPPRKVSASTLGAEVAKLGLPIDSSAIYFVYTSNFPNGGGFCAWHSLTTVNGTEIAVAYMPNTTGVSGCDPGNPYNLTGSEGLRSLANVTAHEFMEAVTDPLPASGSYAWIDQSGSEIGDKCAWRFSGPVMLGGTKWQLQEEWSNSDGGCVQGQ
jgi:hypothetical protein